MNPANVKWAPPAVVDCNRLFIAQSDQLLDGEHKSPPDLTAWVEEHYQVEQKKIKHDRVSFAEERRYLDSVSWEYIGALSNIEGEDGIVLGITSYWFGRENAPSTAQALECLGEPDGYVVEYMNLLNTEEDDAVFKLRIFWLDQGIILQTFVPAKEQLQESEHGVLFPEQSSAATVPIGSISRVMPGSLDEVIWRGDYSPKYSMGWASEERTARTAARYLPWPGSAGDLVFTVTAQEAATPLPTPIITSRDYGDASD